MKHIRNFSIIAHIDHGKSTLADRMLEITKTVPERKMKEQVLDSMELERERGITIKMQPVRMVWKDAHKKDSEEYVLNLIDTPGHIDFSYEVSRALKAVEGAVLLVDSTQGVQAQTLTTLSMAREAGLVIIPAISKIDSPLSRRDEVRLEMASLLDCDPDDILEVSGKTGEGVEALLHAVVQRISPPAVYDTASFKSLVFDFKYSNHKGVIVFVRVMSGKVARGDQTVFQVARERFSPLEVGTFSPEETTRDSLSAGEIGYIVTGIKEPGIASVGDTIARFPTESDPLPGYMSPRPVVWASLYPESQDDFTLLKQALSRLRLSDSSFTHEEESSGALGRGFRCGFLGMLHLEIITERLRREFNQNLIITSPSITYEVVFRTGKRQTVYSPAFFPDDAHIESVLEPWVSLHLIAPAQYVGSLMQTLFDHEAAVGNSESFGDGRTKITATMPLRELMRNFFDKVKSVSSGYASISYEILDMRQADVVRLDILVADEVVPAFSKVIARRLVEEEAEASVEKLHTVLPRQMFTTKVQGKALGRIISSRTISALKKDVTQHMYGGDITRKMKLREKQKKGKKRMKDRGKVNIPHDVFLKMMKGS
jgi:GTP-binding protein LepA